MTNVRLHDYGCTLKAMTADLAKQFRLYGEMHRFIPAVAASIGARIVEIPPALRSYLQPGYRDNLAGKIELTDEHDRPVELPHSNCLIAIERR